MCKISGKAGCRSCKSLYVLVAAQGPKVELVWETQEPYQSVVDCAVKGVVLRGLTLRHASK